MKGKSVPRQLKAGAGKECPPPPLFSAEFPREDGRKGKKGDFPRGGRDEPERLEIRRLRRGRFRLVRGAEGASPREAVRQMPPLGRPGNALLPMVREGAGGEPEAVAWPAFLTPRSSNGSRGGTSGTPRCPGKGSRGTPAGPDGRRPEFPPRGTDGEAVPRRCTPPA